MQKTRCHVVLNANAGTVHAQHITAHMLEVTMREHGFDPVIDEDTDRPMKERLDAALASDAEVLVAAGGDGTITALASAMVGTRRKLGILPLGTVNALAKDLHIPLDLNAAVDAMALGQCRLIDVARVNDRYFLHKVVVGVIPELAAGREHIRGREDVLAKIGFLRYLFRRLSRARRFALAMDFGDGEPRIERVQALAVASNAYDEGFGRIFARERLDGGQLYVYVLKHLDVMDFFRLSGGMLVGHWREDAALSIHRAERLTITTKKPRMNVMLDGEVEALDTPMEFEILNEALCILAPNPADGDAESPDAPPIGAGA